jgi:hypothetical protein
MIRGALRVWMKQKRLSISCSIMLVSGRFVLKPVFGDDVE